MINATCSIQVSVIIVNYNALCLLDTCLSSVCRFTEDLSYEIIVVDNNTLEGNVEEVVNRYPNTILIKNDSNRGFAAANNQGAQIARGEYLLLLNNDTYFIENAIKKVFDFIKGTDKAIVGCRLLNKDLSLQASMFNFPDLWNIFSSYLFLYRIFPGNRKLNKYHLYNSGAKKISETDVVIGAFMFMKRSDFLDLGGFDERFFFYSEEVDLCYRFKKNGGRVIYFPETQIVHIGGATADKAVWFKYKNQITAYIQFYQKHFPGPKYLLAMVIQDIGIMLRIVISCLLGMATLHKRHFTAAYYYLRQLFVIPVNVFKNNESK